MRQHMGIMREDKKRELNELYSQLIFLELGNVWSIVKWTTLCGVMFVTMWDKEYLLCNIRLAII